MGKPRPRRGWGEGRVTPTKAGGWRAVASAVDPVTGDRSRPSKTFDTKPEAMAWLASLKSAGSSPGSWTVKAWVEHWLAARKREREWASWEWARKRCDRLIVPRIGTTKLADLDRVAVDRWRAGLTADVTTPHESYLAAKVLRMCLGAAVEAGVLARNPAPQARKPPGRVVARVGSWTRDQVSAFLAAAPGTTYESYWWLALNTGARPGELLGLHWTDLDLDAGTVSITKSLSWQNQVPVLKAPKTARGVRVVPITPAVVAKLRQHADRLRDGAGKYGMKGRYDPAKWVFPRPRALEPTHPGRLNCRYFHPLREKAGLPDIRLYDLRHTCATLLLADGVSLRVVADRLGHEDPGVTLRFYAHALPDQQAAALASLFRLMG